MHVPKRWAAQPTDDCKWHMILLVLLVAPRDLKALRLREGSMRQMMRRVYRVRPLIKSELHYSCTVPGAIAPPSFNRIP